MITERPECAVLNCKNPAIGMWGNQLVCAQCMIKLDNKKKEILKKQIEELK